MIELIYDFDILENYKNIKIQKYLLNDNNHFNITKIYEENNEEFRNNKDTFTYYFPSVFIKNNNYYIIVRRNNKLIKLGENNLIIKEKVKLDSRHNIIAYDTNKKKYLKFKYC
tara:strand:- start:79 stop:417 length:339 start_codon:yes stop_codon:yes gene_type:complete